MSSSGRGHKTVDFNSFLSRFLWQFHLLWTLNWSSLFTGLQCFKERIPKAASWGDSSIYGVTTLMALKKVLRGLISDSALPKSLALLLQRKPFKNDIKILLISSKKLFSLLRYLNFWSDFFGYVGKWKIATVNLEIYDVINWKRQWKFGQLILLLLLLIKFYLTHPFTWFFIQILPKIIKRNINT